MPFVSEAQRRYLRWKHPEVYAEFAAATPAGAVLPERVGDPKSVIEKSANFAYDAQAVPIGFERLPKGPLRSGYSSAMLEPVAPSTVAASSLSSVKSLHTPAPSVGSGNTTRIWRPQAKGPGRMGLLVGAGGALAGLGAGAGLTQLLKKGGDYLFDAEDCPKCGASMEGDSYTGTCNSCQHKWGYKKAAFVPEGGTVAYNYHCTPCDHSFDDNDGRCPICDKDRSSTTTNPRLSKSALEKFAMPVTPTPAPMGAAQPKMPGGGNPFNGSPTPTMAPGLPGLAGLRKPAGSMPPPHAAVSMPAPVKATAGAAVNSLMKAGFCPPSAARPETADCVLPGLRWFPRASQAYAAKSAGAPDSNNAFWKHAIGLPPVVGLTANAPVAPQGQPQPPQQLPPTPPPSTAPMVMGNGQPNVDPATGQPVPAAPGTQPQPGQQPAPAQLPQGGQPQQNPPPGQPGNVPTAPMQDPVATPLPANPAMSQPRTPTPADHYQSHVRDGLLNNKIDADLPQNSVQATDDMNAEAFGMGGKMAADLQPRAIGEGNLGNEGMKWHHSDRGTTGQEAVDSLPKYMRNSAKKQNIDPFKLAQDVTPFALGFLRGCEEHGIDPELAFAKVGGDYGEQALVELADMFEKCALPMPDLKAAGKGIYNFGKGLLGGAPKAPAPISPAGPGFKPWAQEADRFAAQTAANSRQMAQPGMAAGVRGNQAMGAARQHLAGSTMGAVSGGFAGNSLGLPGSVGGTPDDPSFNLGGAALGALAGNRRLGGFVSGPGRARGVADTAMAGFRRAGVGNMAGMGVDQTLGAFGINERPDGSAGHTFQNLGTYAGLGSGITRGAQRMLPGLARGGIPRQVAGQMAGAGERLERGMGNFAMGTIDPLIGGMKAVARKPLEWSGLGRLAAPGGGMGALAKSTQAVPTTRGFGRLFGGAGLAAGGAGAGYGMVHDKAREMADSIAAEKLQQFHEGYLPHLKEEAAGFMDDYAKSRGLMGEDGRFDPSGIAHNALGQGVDGMLRSLGIDGSRMSPIQKMMLVGGTAAGGLGMATGHPGLAMLGGGAALAGAAPAYLPRMLGQTGSHLPPAPGQRGFGMAAPQGPQGRNEFEHQQQLQG